MKLVRPLAALSAVVLVATLGCSSGSSRGPSSSTVTPPSTQRQGVFLTAGSNVLIAATDTATVSAVMSGVDLRRLGVTQVSAVYDLTTPADRPLAFNAFARAAGNTGAVRVSLAHVLDAGGAPQGGPETLAGVGFEPSGTALANRDPWVDSNGDGFARVTVQGAIGREQVLAVQSQDDQGIDTALVRIRIGAVSPIAVEVQSPTPAPFVKTQRTLYSSDSFQFGLPTVATSGDRSTVVVYEGDQGDRFGAKRYEMRLQHDEASGAVTGGASSETSPDQGNWRDHEVAALFNVLALVHSGGDTVTLRLSFDRGASFAQSFELERGSGYNCRLVQVAMAADYTLATLFWRTVNDPRRAEGYRVELVLVEAEPKTVDKNGSPVSFELGAPAVLHAAPGDATPVIMGAQYSAGGDLVVGYAYSALSDAPNPGPRPGRASRTEFRCAVRLFGAPGFEDFLVDEVTTWSFDPSVALAGQGRALEIFYGYETDGGVRLKHSADAGKTWGAALSLGDDSAHMPSVVLREQGGATRLDVVYLQRAAAGNELHVAHWDDYASLPASPATHRLTTATTTGAVRGGKSTAVAWLGYDAVVEGDDVVIVYHEQTYDFMDCLPVPMPLGAPMAGGMGARASASSFTAATPPPLAPGLTQAVAAPKASDRNQLKLIRLD
ncbi:MAG: hypothetical protein AB7N76_19635 [Planctomycetota bacterium]